MCVNLKYGSLHNSRHPDSTLGRALPMNETEPLSGVKSSKVKYTNNFGLQKQQLLEERFPCHYPQHTGITYLSPHQSLHYLVIVNTQPTSMLHLTTGTVSEYLVETDDEQRLFSSLPTSMVRIYCQN